MNNQKLADLLFPDLKLTVEEIEKRYPKRNLNSGQQVTRFAPSPTGMMHIGGYFQALLNNIIAKNSNGIFYLRFEDTDQKRKVDIAEQVIHEVMNKFEIKPDEYQYEDTTVGNYGPYRQSERVETYQAYAKKLVAEGKAFPCFCKKTESIEEIREDRAQKFADSGSNEDYDPCRNLSAEDAIKKIKNGEPFSIRLKTNGKDGNKIKIHDEIKGEIEMQENAKDVILIKQDGIPPYAFAHAIDDTLMGTTVVVRGEEWLTQTPVHLEIFKALGFEPIKYLHTPLICKFDEQDGGRRKLSKRKDPEADMRYFITNGYPALSLKEYLLGLISSSFEIWRNSNPTLPYTEFKFDIKNISMNLPIFDLVKFNDVSKNVISRMTASEVYDNVLTWAKEYDKDFAEYLTRNKVYCTKVFNIDREKPKPRKDIYNWKMVKSCFAYMFENPIVNELEECDKAKYEEVVKAYGKDFSLPATKEDWFAGVKTLAEKLGYATDNKLYKANPDAFKGNTAKFCEFIRIALTGKKDSPDLYEIMTILGEQEIKKRLS